MQTDSKLTNVWLVVSTFLFCANSYGLVPPPVISQPQSATVAEGSDIIFVVEADNAGFVLPSITSGNLRLWLKADSGVLVSESNHVSQWSDFSGLTNHCFQSDANKQPLLVTNGFNGRPVIRFDGIQDTIAGDYLQGTGNVGLLDGFTAFMIYAKADRTVPEEGVALIGVPSVLNAARGFYIRSIAGISNEMAFSGWGNDYGSGFRIPTLTPRIWTERLSASKTLIEFFDTDGAADFASSRVAKKLISPGNGYYVGGLGSEKRNFKGDIAEVVYYQGAISDADRTAVENYLRQKYFLPSSDVLIEYQWLFEGREITGATNASLTLHQVQLADAGNYSVVAKNAAGSVTSSNALLTVVPTNHAPIAAPQSYSIEEDNELPILLVATDPDGDALNYVVTSPTKGTLSGTAPNLIYRPNANFHGADSFTFKVNDGKADSTTVTISLTVLSVNDAPVAFSQNVSVNEDNSIALTLIGVDADGDELAYTVDSPAHGTWSGVAPHIAFTPNPDFNGSDSITFKVSDGELDSIVATIHIGIASVNDVPVALASASPAYLFSSNEISTVVISTCDGNATVTLDASQSHDAEEDSLQYFWLEGTNLLATGQIASNSFTIGSHTITLAVSDGSDTSFATLELEVITPAESVAELVLFVNNSRLLRNRKQPLLASLKAAIASFERCQMIPAINQLEAFERKVDSEITPSDPGVAQDLLRICNEIIERTESN